VVVDCGAIPAALSESVLFGHEKGAFTGADSRRPSPFEDAAGGTLFLDELGELPLEVQPKLLRVLAERRVKRVGSNSYRDVDVRIVAATRRNLLCSVNEGAFRSDLYFRVADVRLELPALRERIEDVPLLVRHFLEERSDADSYDRIPAEMIERLVRHDWPGNVRELKSAINVALALAEPGKVIDVAAQIREVADAGASNATMAALLPYHSAKQEALERFERQYFAALASLAPDNITEMARRAGLQRAHVRKYLARHDLLGVRSQAKQRA
jgi:DNA-binding NtrC family response regulator